MKILLCGSALLALVVTIQAVELERSWRQSAESTRRQAENVASVAGEEIARTFQGIRLAFTGVNDLLVFQPGLRFNDPVLRRTLDGKTNDLPHVRRLVLIDRDGWDMIPFGGATPVNVSDRDYFIDHRDNATTALRIGVPQPGRVVSRLSVPVTQRLNDANGTFAGVVLALVNPNAIDEIYRTVDLGKDGTMTLFRNDGVLLARTPMDERLLGHSVANSNIFRQWMSGPASGASMGEGAVDGVLRIIGHSRLKDFPLIMAVGIDAQRAQERWLLRLSTEIAKLVAYALGICLAMYFLARAAKRQDALIGDVRQSEQRFRDFAEIASDWVCELDADLRFSYISPRRQEISGSPPEAMLGRTPFEVASPQDLAEQRDAYEMHRQDLDARREFRNFEFSVTMPNGARHFVSISGRPVFGHDGAFKGYRGAVTDHTARILAEHARHHADVRLLDAINSLTDGFALFDPRGGLTLWNRAYAEAYPNGSTPRHGDRFEDLVIAFAPHVALPNSLGGSVNEWIANRIAYHRNPTTPFMLPLRDGRHLRVSEVRTHDGSTVLLRTDDTARHKAEEALARSQRLDAVGQLTGGIAHDFNNLLTIILLQAEALTREAQSHGVDGGMLDPIVVAARRGSELIRQLLIFSRRQPLRPENIDANRLLQELQPLLRRTLSEDILLSLALTPNLRLCTADRVQLESAILNLVINARDAMPHGGALVIRTENVSAGGDSGAGKPAPSGQDIVAITIADTGHGMDADVLNRAFEPFFTTKPTGQGTGLGLSMVYGFAKQTGGDVAVDSTVGKGTTVRLLLPAAAPEAVPETDPRDEDSAPGAGECILVVEDDAAVRTATTARLRALGYAVVDAADGRSALAILTNRDDVALLFTDMIMPGGMTGQELAIEAMRRRPGVKILITTGYAGNAIGLSGQFDVLPKPYRTSVLAARIRAALRPEAKDA